ncbi:hypothetical protein OG887_19765 [Streptomyces sp. NBC_00053]|uniref:DUF6879 family protein n=1 Tax=unclassified Streptomyces TaxID=2593676 RepID=UPI000F5BBE1D|nr:MULTISPECIES: DUF6879 family protein [unclassified Streptomyces]WSG51862.1 hypothetical protein OHA38_19830 [Streptomyces sp. NBC_01732]WSX02519.1 hypothetical protein OG355_19965 [Streptomyces sp. NBC_00987]MCX4395566.1 hypothetical protein [Streptomyces sp. NBC_01767]MCX5101805.1 hypothetical protein [Streptomyces sp. NBC_00439]MCX5161324.1 hypothetical protein [Streptomyces sp. NBC_00305]
MTLFIDDETFGDYFTGFEHTAWRLETRRGYDSDRTSERYQQFLSGEELLDSTNSPWCANIRLQTEQGKRIERVRIVDSPPTEDQLFLLASAARNNAAGEDIRNLWRADASELDLPDVDFWLFDSRRALVLHFDEQDRLLGTELVEDPARILAFCQVRDAAWHRAIPRTEFVTQVASTV